MFKTLSLGWLFSISLTACGVDAPEEATIDVIDDKTDTAASCAVLAKPLHSFEASDLPLAPDARSFTEPVRMRRKGGVGRCERIDSPWFRIDNTGDEAITVEAKLGGIDKVFLRWLVRKTDANGALVVQGMTASVLAPAGIELTGVIDGIGPQFAMATLAPGERLETIAVPNSIGSRGFGWFPLPTFSLSQL